MHRTFSPPIDTQDHATEVLRSLYLPGVAPGRLRRGNLVLARRVGGTLAVPLRRVELERSP
ncbi:MAG: hypothetical protein ACRD29_23475 [Acidimicrobiales bacterium]